MHKKLPSMLRNLFHLNKIFSILFLGGLFFFACTDAKQKSKKIVSEKDSLFSLTYPFGFEELTFPLDKQLTKVRVELGKKIFFDTQFSADKKISCSSCHHPELAFADTVQFNFGSHDSINKRNTPSILNIGYHKLFDYDGGVPTLEQQVLVPFDGEKEMQSNLVKAAELMKKDKLYVSLSQKSYWRNPDPYVIVRALAAYQRSLISTGSKYDLQKKYPSKKVLTTEEKDGMNLFFSDKTNCSKCHNGFLFTNLGFENIGLPINGSDSGRILVTLKLTDFAKFKTPGLRNVAKTFPYMHDGSLQSLEKVIEFYNKGGIEKRNKSPFIKPLGLTKIEQKALISFLKTLNDTI